MATVAVLGGGISGLSCAYYLKRLGRSNIRYIFLLEKSPTFGGWIQTTRYPDGAIFEHGPRTLRVPSKPGYNALELAEQLGLQSSILPVARNHPTAKNNFILSGEKLHPMPRGLLDCLKKSPPFSKPLIWYLINEIRTKKSDLDDESIYSFIERRVGKEISDFVLDPVCRGITAGDARDLSVRSMFPLIFNAEKQYGSIIKGIVKSRKSSPVYDYMHSDLVRKAVNEKWRMWSLKTGLTELIDALASSIDEREIADLIFNAKCSHIEFKDNKAEIVVDNEKISVHHVFSSIPSYHLANLIPQYPKLCDALNSISFVDVAVVYLEYSDKVLNYPGFGYLVPSFEDSKVLGIVFDSNCFPQLNGQSQTRLTCMIGGKWFKDVLGDPNKVTDEQILNIAIEETRRNLQINVLPVRHKVTVQRNCIPQYVVGHYKKLEAAENTIKENNICLSLIGSSYRGAGVPDCIYNSRLAVEDFLEKMK